jgi:predicted RNA-binding Zn-ribbon protein involved in translation (DUF1610 family)
MHNFLCPKCDGNIRVGDQVILKVKTHRKQAGLILLSPHIGNYTSIKHPTFIIEKDDYLEFYCPICNGSLESDIHQNLAHVILCDESGKCNDVYFSRVAGEHSTFTTDGDSVHVAGEDAGKYTYFKIGDKFKKYF